jgi:hypothetical protein
VYGYVVGYPDGQPIPDAQVLVMDPRGSSIEAFTDADGRFGAAVGDGLFRVRARPDAATNRIGAYWGDSFGFCPAQTVELAGEVEFDEVLIELPGGGAIEGTVLDEEGDPLVGIAVSATGLDFYNSSVVRSAETDAEGRFRIVGVDSVVVDGTPVPGHYRVSVRGGVVWYHPGVWGAVDALAVETLRGETAELPPLVRPAPGRLEGRIVDAAGDPVEGADVEAYAHDGGALHVAWTDADGRFAVDPLQGDRVEITASAPGLAEVTAPERLEIEPGEMVVAPDLALATEATLSGAIGPLDAPASLQLVDPESGVSLRYALLSEDEASYSFDRLAAGSWRLDLRPVTGSDMQPLQIPIDLEAGEDAVLDLAPEPGASVTGSVRGRAARLLRGATVTALDPATGLELPRGRTTAIEAATFTLRGLPVGGALVRVAWEPFCSTDPTWVMRFADGAERIEDASPLSLDVASPVDLGEILLAPDRDTDGMDDIWELAWGLDRGRADGPPDPDGDGASNLQEYLARTDPLVAEVADGTGGCSHGPNRPPVLLVLLTWLAIVPMLTRARAGARMRRPNPAWRSEACPPGGHDPAKAAPSSRGC